MNERIRELRNEAEKWVADNFSTDELDPYEWWEKEEQKFAELIVRECAEIGDGYDNETKYNQGLIDIQTAGDEIRKHFGVAN